MFGQELRLILFNKEDLIGFVIRWNANLGETIFAKQFTMN